MKINHYGLFLLDPDFHNIFSASWNKS